MPTSTFKVGEMLNKRTPNSKTWINFDGSYTTEIHSGIVHYDDENGNLHNINTDLFDEADLDIVDYPVACEGTERFKQSQKETIEAKKKDILNRDNWNFQGLRVPFDCHIPRNFMRGYTIGKGVDKLTFKPIKSSPSKGYLDTNDRSIINYQDVWNDTDVQLKILTNGVKESIFLKSDRSPNSFSFEVVGNIDTLTELKLADAWLIDNMGTKRDVSQTIRHENNKIYVDLVADVTNLVYPIEIDPTVTINPSTNLEACYARELYPDTTHNNSTVDIGSTTSEKLRGFIKHDFSNDIPNGSIVSDAKFYVEIADATNSTPNPFYGAIVQSSWSEASLTWNNQPGITGSLISIGSLSGTYGKGYLTITDLVKQWIENGVTNNGFRISNDTLGRKTSFWSDSASTVDYRPSFEVTYNSPPTKPTIISPNGGETWNSLHNINWTASTDTDNAQSNLKYNVQLSVDNGASWKDIVALTNAGVTNYDYDFINEVESSTCLIRIRAYDGTIYGEWDMSDGVFTIQHNQAPSTPTNLNPVSGVYDRATVIQLSWQHNDNDGDPQAQFDLRWRLQGASTWNTVTQVTTNQYYDMPENTLPDGSIEWQVRTYDQSGLSSSYSNIQVFKTSNKPSAPTITSPTESEVISSSDLVVQWSSVGQSGYHVKTLDNNDVLLWETIKTSTNKAQSVQYDLLNNTDYKIQVAIKNSDGLWSDFSTVNISTSYTPPRQPNVRVLNDLNRGSITFMIDNPSPIDTEPATEYNNIFRRLEGGEWDRIATNVLGSFTDYTPISNQAYEYKVRAWGDNGTFTDSSVVRALVSVNHAQISLVSDYSKWVEIKLNPQRNESQKVNREMMQFSGRKYPVAEFGEQSEFNLGLSCLVFDIEELNKLRDLCNSCETLLYRDNRGRKAYVTVDGIKVTDEQPRHYSVTLQPSVVSYTEVV